jgi:hypothetical protein
MKTPVRKLLRDDAMACSIPKQNTYLRPSPIEEHEQFAAQNVSSEIALPPAATIHQSSSADRSESPL